MPAWRGNESNSQGLESNGASSTTFISPADAGIVPKAMCSRNGSDSKIIDWMVMVLWWAAFNPTCRSLGGQVKIPAPWLAATSSMPAANNVDSHRSSLGR